MRFTNSLRSRFAILIALLVSLLSWLLGALIGENSSQRIRKEVGNNLAESSFQMVDRLDRDMASRAAYLQVLGSLRALRQPDDIGEVRALLDRLQLQIPSIAWIGFTDPQGTVLASSNGVLEGANIAQRPVYSEGSKGLFVGDVHEAVLLAKLLPNPTGEAMKFVDISFPVQGNDGHIVGVLACHLSWKWAEDVRQSLLDPMQERRNVEFLVLSRDHTILLGPSDLIGQKLDLHNLESQGEKTIQWAEQRWPDGQNYLTGFASSQGYKDYPGLGWIVVARQSLDEAYAPARELMHTTFLLGFFLALVFAFVGWIFTGYFTDPLRRIVRAADRLSAGEPVPIPELESPLELVTLSRSIRHLVASLTDQHKALDVMEQRAHQDPLTGLPNRAALERFLPAAEARIQASGGCLALLCLDLDSFKPVNDRFGHPAGDQLLKQVAERLRNCLRDGDMVARLGGDEFLMVLQLSSEEAVQLSAQVSERLLQALNSPFALDAGSVRIGCSIGGAVWPHDHQTLSDALALADQALYSAKHAGRNRVVFHSEEAAVAV
ncbi:sensor domain-containing diguanylate cyclase [Pseudomonas sp. LRF_L74]|uniref:sensor domain-containing diguanylate cyclase n=1 Tax=Pseudomonas sp. LRF_L74 TaxID=3369422 RepID=UPI003F636146